MAKQAALHPRFHLPAHTMVGNCLADLGEHELAIEAYLHALEHQPLKTVRAWAFLSYSLGMCDRHEESDFCLYTALQIDPNYDEAHFNLGVSAREREDLAEAEHHLRNAVDLAPDEVRARLYLAQLHWARGRIDEADRENRFGDASKFRQRVKTIAEDMTRAYLGPLAQEESDPDF